MNLPLTKKLGLPLLLLLFMMASTVTLYAQGGITGVVVDSAGEPIIGANVIVDGTTTGAITSVDGSFTLNAKVGSAITASFIGYTDTKAVLANGVRIVLADDATQIEELVVIGYGTAKKETLTGSIAVVGDEIMQSKGTISNPLAALQGQVPGVFVTRESSAPGNENWSINLRGSTSLNSSSPLVVIDGFACASTGEMRLMNPNDIESISFLKDGAAAIYGSNAAAGVILITTKKGAAGKVAVEYSSSATYSFVGNAPEMCTLSDWATITLEAAESSASTGGTVLTDQWISYLEIAAMYPNGLIDSSTTTYPFPSWTGLLDFPLFTDTDWYDTLWGGYWSTDNNVSFSGGGDKVTYRMSFGHQFNGSPLQCGVNNNNRYSISSKTNYKLSDKLSWDSSISYDKTHTVTPTNISSALTSNPPQPGMPYVNVNGDAYSWGSWGNPYAEIVWGGENTLKVDKIVINQGLTYKPTEWLTGNLMAGYSRNAANRSIVTKSIDYYSYLGDYVMTDPSSENSSYVMTTGITDTYSMSGYFTGVKNINEVHDFSLTLGGQYDFQEYIYYGIEAEDIQDSLDIVNGSGDVTINSTSHWQTATLSGFGRFNYSYDERYLLEINARYDGSSKFQPENRWDLFGGASIAWRISEEEFMDNADWVSNLKLRASYSSMGTQAGIGTYDGVQLYNLYQGSGAYAGDDTYLSYIKTNGTFASTTRQWERIGNSNIGIDFGFFDNKLSGTFDLYRKNNNNMLISIDLPSTLGDSAPKSNVGKFQAQGYEGSLSYRGRITDDLTFYVGATISYSEDELVEYDGSSVLTTGYTSTQVGYGMNSLFGYSVTGKFATDAEAAEYYEKYYSTSNCNMPSTALRAGDNIFEDVNEDGVIDENDIIYLGSDTAPYSFSFNFGFGYNGFDLSAVLQGVSGRVVYNGNTGYTVPTRAVYINSTTASFGNVWTPDNTDAYYSPYTLDSNINNYNYQATSLTAQDASYLRLKNLSLGYTFTSLQSVGIESLRVYASGTDLWEISNMQDGFDPEAAYQASGTERYPFMRSISFGINLVF